MKKRYIWILAVLALPCSSAGNAQQIYPSRPVRLVITVPPGGAADLIARIMAQKLGDAFGQTGTPKKIIAMLNAESNRILATQEVKDRMAGAGIDAAGGTPEEFANFIRAELAKWGPVVKAAGAKLD